MEDLLQPLTSCTRRPLRLVDPAHQVTRLSKLEHRADQLHRPRDTGSVYIRALLRHSRAAEAEGFVIRQNVPPRAPGLCGPFAETTLLITDAATEIMRRRTSPTHRGAHGLAKCEERRRQTARSRTGGTNPDDSPEGREPSYAPTGASGESNGTKGAPS